MSGTVSCHALSSLSSTIYIHKNISCPLRSSTFLIPTQKLHWSTSSDRFLSTIQPSFEILTPSSPLQKLLLIADDMMRKFPSVKRQRSETSKRGEKTLWKPETKRCESTKMLREGLKNRKAAMERTSRISPFANKRSFRYPIGYCEVIDPFWLRTEIYSMLKWRMLCFPLIFETRTCKIMGQKNCKDRLKLSSSIKWLS